MKIFATVNLTLLTTEKEIRLFNFIFALRYKKKRKKEKEIWISRSLYKNY